MQADDLVERVPVVHRGTNALEAARIIATLRVSGVVVADDHDEPVAVIPGTQVLRLVVPRYVLDNAALAHVYDEAGADEICARLREHSVGELLDDKDVATKRLPQVKPNDTLIEIAAVMVREHAPVVVVRYPGASSIGVVTLSRVLAAILDAAGEAGPGVTHTLTNDLTDVLDSSNAQQSGDGDDAPS